MHLRIKPICQLKSFDEPTIISKMIQWWTFQCFLFTASECFKPYTSSHLF